MLWTLGIAALIWALPVKAEITLRRGRPPRLAVSLGPMRAAWRGRLLWHPHRGLGLAFASRGVAPSFTLPLKARRPKLPKGKNPAGKYLIRRVKAQSLRIEGVISAGDAAHTALLYALADGLLALCRLLNPALPLTVRLNPDFRSGSGDYQAEGIFSCRLGYIIAAALMGWLDKLARRPRT